MAHACEVRIYRATRGCRGNRGAEVVHACDKCRIGCFKPARWRNPFFGKDYPDEAHWWRNPYSYAEWLCAEHYDGAMETLKEYEDIYGEEN